MRTFELKRTTTETDVNIRINLGGKGIYNIDTGIGFFDHMLELFAKHSGFDLTISAKGDTHIDLHHTIEDVGITLGSCILKALGDKKGINRYGFFILPMDETLVECAVDLSGRAFLNYDVKCYTENIGEFPVEMVVEFFRAISENLKANIHIIKKYGKNSHHIVEAVFKAFGRSIREAVKITGDEIPSTKGIL